jgi:hypothetical protein
MTSTETPVPGGSLPGADLSRDQLAVLAREWFLHGHLQDRVGIPLLYEQGVEREGAEQIAIDEWMGASPIYSVRMQESLGFRGDTVDVILKNLQLDIGAPLQYMDFRLTLHDEHHAEFRLDHCGALMDVEPIGDEWVRGMCHTIEDPTFDATAVATNPRAAMRPIHRPPRVPADRMPHCHWTITIAPENPVAEPHPNLAVVDGSRVAQLPIARPAAEPDDDGRVGYGGAFDPDLAYEAWSAQTLRVVLREAAIQSHLLMRSYCLSVHQRLGDAAQRALAPRVLVGVAGVTAGRLVRALDLGTDLDGIERVLHLHPSLHPRDYVDVRVTRPSAGIVRLAFGPAPVFSESDTFTWYTGIGVDGDRGVDALVRGVNAAAQAVAVAPVGDEVATYEISLGAEPRVEEPETTLARFSGAASFEFR